MPDQKLKEILENLPKGCSISINVIENYEKSCEKVCPSCGSEDVKNLGKFDWVFDVDGTIHKASGINTYECRWCFCKFAENMRFDNEV